MTRIQVLLPSASLFDPGILVLAWSALLAAGVLGALLPIRRTLKIAPAEVLRDDRV